MKPVLTSLLLFMFYLSTAQIPLDSFYRDGARWVDLSYFVHAPSSSSLVRSSGAYEYIINGDTNINTVQYKKIYRRGIYSRTIKDGSDNSSIVDISDPFLYIGRLRTDNNTKVFFTDDRNNASSPYIIGEENMIYNFGQTIGDTLYLSSKFGATLITSIDTITINSGHKIKKYNKYILEGIGSIYGILGSGMIHYGPGPTYQTANLCYESGSMFYKSGAKDGNNLLNWYMLENCYDINLLNTHEINVPTKLSVFPNPTHNTINLRGSIIGKYAKLVLYNNIGQIVYNTQREILNNSLHTTLHIPDLAPGIYNLILTTEKTSSTTRILVE